MWHLWLQLFSKGWHVKACSIFAWREKAIQMWHLWLQLFSKSTEKRHFVSVHQGEKSFKCDICDYSCSQKSTMLHQFMKGKKPLKCEICDYSCSQKNIMKTHVVSVHEGKKPFKCNICDHSFSKKQNLNTHVHEEKKLFKCNICDGLEKHTRNNHEEFFIWTCCFLKQHVHMKNCSRLASHPINWWMKVNFSKITSWSSFS